MINIRVLTLRIHSVVSHQRLQRLFKRLTYFLLQLNLSFLLKHYIILLERV